MDLVCERDKYGALLEMSLWQLLRVGLQPQTVFVNMSYGAVKSGCGVLKNKLQHVEERERERWGLVLVLVLEVMVMIVSSSSSERPMLERERERERG